MKISIPHALEHKINPVLADEHLRSLNDTVIVQFEPQPGCSRNYKISDKEINVPLEQKTISDDFVLTGKKPWSISTNFSVPVYLKNDVEQNSKRLRFAISKATKYRIKENTDFKKKVELLERDILNAPSHVFGEHAECKAINYFKCDKNGTPIS
ncbi:unnamed protein product [Psylliodes chrysocephalus]|uniref:Uncharacterized protein n=1 Tax=Psylliodes chrysocephalus TaxID=3402493 RepID=A0A9P0GDX4_9CUCU|nr:unnamed protein product [Psylliodes chrysocephala]